MSAIVPTFQAIGYKDFIFLGLSANITASTIVGKIKKISADFQENIKEGLEKTSEALQGSSLAINVVLLPMSATNVVSTCKGIKPKVVSVISGDLKNETLETKIYVLWELTLQVAQSVKNLLLTALMIVKLALDLIPTQILENAKEVFTPLKVIIPIFNDITNTFNMIVTPLTYILMGHLALKIARQAYFIFQHHLMTKVTPEGSDRLDFWTKRPFIMKNDAHLFC